MSHRDLLESLNKQELNTLLTTHPLGCGGYTPGSLSTIKKDELVAEVLELEAASEKLGKHKFVIVVRVAKTTHVLQSANDVKLFLEQYKALDVEPDKVTEPKGNVRATIYLGEDDVRTATTMKELVELFTSDEFKSIGGRVAGRGAPKGQREKAVPYEDVVKLIETAYDAVNIQPWIEREKIVGIKFNLPDVKRRLNVIIRVDGTFTVKHPFKLKQVSMNDVVTTFREDQARKDVAKQEKAEADGFKTAKLEQPADGE